MMNIGFVEDVVAMIREDDKEAVETMNETQRSKERPIDKSNSRCYNFKELEHFAYECQRSKKDEKAQVSKVEEKQQCTHITEIVEILEVFSQRSGWEVNE